MDTAACTKDEDRAIEIDADEDFDLPVRSLVADVDELIVNIDGYQGPLDLLLELARSQKVDLRRVSILPLVEQYLAFVEAAKALRLDLAADYLVMASWLAFLKTKLLLPKSETGDDEPTADEMAARLAFQLQRLEAMRRAVSELFARPQEGVDFVARGEPEGRKIERRKEWRADLFDLLKAYTTQRIGNLQRTYSPPPPPVFSIEEARARLARILGDIPDWTDLRVLAPFQTEGAPRASVLASAFNAILEFAKDGRIELRQLGHYEPLFLRPRRGETPGIDGGISPIGPRQGG
ncbi:MAG: segregation/condensation protein A [Alphaproteobacteria bacterium]|nr:segregation/condensation protein A [Alphaproteobacteria bacterium]